MHSIPLPVLILQHPQEPSRKDGEVSSARILTKHLSPSFVKVGLSWRNLASALRGWKDIEDVAELNRPALWYTLYLGTRQESRTQANPEPGIYFLDKKGEPMPAPPAPEIGGLILLDGTWSQAKTLWWRNPWLLKTQRIYIVPRQKSLYGNLRKEPRPECVSTLEAAAETLAFLGMAPSLEESLKSEFSAQLERFRKSKRERA